MPNLFKALPRNRSTIAVAAVLVASPAFAALDYPPGLFEKPSVVPSGPPDATAPSQPPDAADPFGPPDAGDPLDDYCDGLASRTFGSLAKAPADGAGRPCTPLSKTDRHHVSGGDEPMRELRSLWGGF
jgi:hypothetical protein